MMKKLMLIWAAAAIACVSGVNAEEASEAFEVRIFNYENLEYEFEGIMEYLHDYGFIAVRGVPGFVEKRARMFEMAQAFVALDDETKSMCTPENANARGWSCGIEEFNGKVDTLKGSYYASLGNEEEEEGNVWPEEFWGRGEEFREAYEDLGGLMLKASKRVMSVIGLDFGEVMGAGRMLHYGKTPEGDVEGNDADGNPNWCGVHRDHGLITALVPSLLLKDGKPAKKPAGTGLYIRDREIVVPDDVMMFQVGEVVDLVTNREIRATLHHVKKAYGGYERYSFAFFIDAMNDFEIYSTNVHPDYAGRYYPGITFRKWGEDTLDLYFANRTKK